MHLYLNKSIYYIIYAITNVTFSPPMPPHTQPAPPLP